MKTPELISALKAGFQKRFWAAWIVSLTAILCSLPFPLILRLLFLITFLIATELFMLIYIPRIVEGGLWQIRLICSKEVRWQEVPDWLVRIGKEMGVKIKKFGVKKGLYNACTRMDGAVIIGEDLLKDLEKDELIGVCGHELAHLKDRRKTTAVFLVWMIFARQLFDWLVLQPLFWAAMPAYLLVTSIPFLWWQEQRADRIAASLQSVGVKRVRSALLKFAKKVNPRECSETHPSLASRIESLDRLLRNK